MAKIRLKKDWKFYTGMTFITLSFILPLFGLAVPIFEMPAAITLPVMAFLTIGGPEIMMVIAAAFLGKKVYHYFRNKIFAFFKKKSKPKPVSKTRYYIGLTIMLLTIIPFYLNAYIPIIFPESLYMKDLILLSADLLFVISFFILGAEFWGKFKKLFIWKNNKIEKLPK